MRIEDLSIYLEDIYELLPDFLLVQENLQIREFPAKNNNYCKFVLTNDTVHTDEFLL